MFENYKLSKVLKLSGHPTWQFIGWTKTAEHEVDELKTYFMQEAFSSGLLVLGTLNITLSHLKQEKNILDKFDSVLSKLSSTLQSGQLRDLLQVEPLHPLFKVR